MINDLPPETSLPIDFSGWRLDWATAAEFGDFYADLRTYAAPHFGRPTQEMRITLNEDGGANYEELPPGHWRYAVVRPLTPDALSADRLAEALRISEADLWVEGWLVSPIGDPRPAGMLGRVGVMGQYLADFATRPFVPPALPVANLTATVESAAALEEALFPHIVRSMKLFRDLDAVPEASPAKVLGYFSVLESVLCHAPQSSDPVDSITRQLKRNLVAVDHRLPSATRLPLTAFNDSSGADQIVSKLYAVRSALAHGDEPIKHLNWLESRLPDELVSPIWLARLMRSVTQRVLQAALSEPQLIQDLRG